MEDLNKIVPTDLDTKIIHSEIRQLGNISFKVETWDWDGILGHSLIFTEESFATLNEESLKTLFQAESGLSIDSSYIKHTTGLVFINYTKENL